MKKFKLSAMLIFMSMLLFSACGGGGGGRSDDPGKPGDSDKTISISIINGVTPPAYGEIPVSVIAENEQYTGTVTWNDSPSSFAASKVYTATIELTAKDGFTLDGVSDDFFEIAGAASVSNDDDSGIIIVVFPATGLTPPTVVNIKAVSGVTVPEKDGIPVTEIKETEQYTGTIRWSGSPVKFASSTIYTATIALTAKSGYTFNGISDDSFLISGATSIKNNKNSGVITAIFPSTITAVIAFPSGTSFNMTLTPNIATTNTFKGGYTFFSSEDEIVNVPARFIIAETEVTYALWEEVYNWATDSARGTERYYFSNPGQKGNDGAVSKTSQHPVTSVSLFDAIIWCNALTEYYNANNGSETDLVCVYTYNNEIIRDSRYENASATSAVAVYDVSSTAIVKSKVASGVNALGLYDMSGNVWEWCYDIYVGSDRVFRGGAYDILTHSMRLGDVNGVNPYNEISGIGFRFCRNR